jgi:hypothetical protein
MDISEFISELNDLKTNFEHHLHFNAESPKRVQREIQMALKFLKSIKYEGELENRVKTSIDYLKLAHDNADTFAKEMKPDMTKRSDLAVTHPDEMFWYQQVIGTAEASMDLLTRYLTDNE